VHYLGVRWLVVLNTGKVTATRSSVRLCMYRGRRVAKRPSRKLFYFGRRSIVTAAAAFSGA